MEDRWIPYSSLWWRFWTPRIPVGERYQEGAFTGYSNGEDDDDDDDADPSTMPALDIRRMLANPVIRKLYKKLPYIDVVPIVRPWDTMPPDQQADRTQFVTDSTLAAYHAGKALYPRATILQIESQLDAAAAKLARRRRGLLRLPLPRLRQRLFSHCEAPQTAFLSFPAYDAVTTHVSTWSPGAALTLSDGATVYTPGRSQVEFRTIQELTQPEPVAAGQAEQFVPDSWLPSVGYQPIMVGRRMHPQDMWVAFGEEEEQLGVAGLEGRLGENRARVEASAEWGALKERGPKVVGGVDKIVFFYGNGMSDDCDYCKRAMFLFAVAVCLRDWVKEMRGGAAGPTIPIYMPAFDTLRRWNPAEEEFLANNGVEFVDSNGELFLKIDERTAVMSYRNWNPVKQVVADLAKPALLICRPVSDDPEDDFAWKEQENDDGETITVPTVRSRFLESSTIVVDPDSPRVRELVKDYDKFELPELPQGAADKEVLSVYMRKADASTKVEYW